MTGPRSSLFTSVRHARRRPWVGTLKYVLIGLVALLVLAVVSALGLWRYASSRIERQDIPSLASDDPTGSPTGSTDEPADVAIVETLNVLVVGTDSREGLTDEELAELGTEDVGSNLTDTIMLVQVSAGREKAAILSFPRDLRVQPPGAGTRKINAVVSTGGPDLLVRTVEDLTGVAVDHYVEVDLAGFIQLTDAIGGVEICLDEPKVDRFAGVDLPAGCQELSGKQAVGFVRSRQDADQFGPADDFGRIARQQYFIKQAMSEVTKAGTLLNPLKVKRLIDVVADNVKTDRDLGPSDMFRLANALKDLSTEDLTTRTVPGAWDAESGYTLMFPEQAEQLFQALRQGARLPDVGMTDPRQNELSPDEIEVRILNGVGTEGLAADVAAFLGERGFPVVDTANAERNGEPDFSYETTVISHASGDRPLARKVADFFPGATVEEVESTPEGIDVVVTVGRDWERP